jgi:hypothetical protein
MKNTSTYINIKNSGNVTNLQGTLQKSVNIGNIQGTFEGSQGTL